MIAVVTDRAIGTATGDFATSVAAAPDERKNDSPVIHCFCRAYLVDRSPKYRQRVSAASLLRHTALIWCSVSMCAVSSYRGLRPRRSCGFDRLARLREFLAGQRIEGQPLAEYGGGGFDEASGVRQLAVVETVNLFIEVTEQVERLNRHVSALQSALQEAPEVLAAVGVDLPVHVAFGVDDDVVSIVGVQAVVREQFVGVDFRSASDVLADLRLKDRLPVALHDTRTHGAVAIFAVPREQTHDGNLAFAASALDDAVALPLVHVPRLTADVSLVNLDVTSDFGKRLVLHGETQPVQHEPRGLLSDTDVAREFVAADAVLAVDEHPERRKPLIEADGGILENRSDLDRELLFAGTALPDHPGFQEGDFLALAVRTSDAIRPAQRGHEIDGDFLVSEELDRVEQGFKRVLGSHAYEYRRFGPVCQLYCCPCQGIQFF